MKLPPHILPTLDELDSKSMRQNLEQQIGIKKQSFLTIQTLTLMTFLGVYMPDRRNPLGVYVPRPSQSPSTTLHREKKRTKPKNSLPMNRLEKDLPTFTLQSPFAKMMGKL